jgi:hypothetical protein
MRKSATSICRRWVLVLTAFSLIMFWPLGGPLVVSAQAPGALCTLNVVAEGEVLSIMVNSPENLDLAVALPTGKDVSAPVLCEDVQTLAVGVANQTNANVNVAVQIFSHDGTSLCSKGPFVVVVNGGRGFTFTDCQ